MLWSLDVKAHGDFKLKKGHIVTICFIVAWDEMISTANKFKQGKADFEPSG